MKLTKDEEERIGKFRSYNNLGFLDTKFTEIKSRFEELYNLVEEMIEVYEKKEFFPENIGKDVNDIVIIFNQFYDDIEAQNKEGNSLKETKQDIISRFLGLYNTGIGILKLDDNGNQKKVDFYVTYNTCKSLSGELKASKKLLTDAKELAGGVTIKNYAKIFENEAVKYSNWFGIAERWLILAFTLSIILLVFFRYYAFFDSNKDIVSLSLITRFAFFSFLIYLTTFSFRQYSINKHLATVNKHRANALTSYKLFIETIGKEDTESRNALMMEVAKAIYEAGNTGYLSAKKQNSSNPVSLINLIKDIKPS